jgi:carbonic anhydrase
MKNKLSIVVSCIDYRFWPIALPLLQKEFGDFDLIGLAGASKNIASPLHEADRHAVLESIRTSISLHNAETLILTNHLDCGAYGGSKKFSSYEEELNFHKLELQKAEKIVGEIFPKLKIKTLFITKNDRSEIKFI